MAQPKADVVAILRDMLAFAERGEMIEIVGVGSLGGNRVVQFKSNGAEWSAPVIEGMEEMLVIVRGDGRNRERAN